MNKQQKFALNLLKGFTIIEIIVVVAIIAVLASIILANVTSYNIKSKDAAAKSNLNNLLTAVVKYYEINGTYEGALDSGINSDTKNIVNGLTKLGYMDSDVGLGGTDEGNFCLSIKLKQFSTPTYYCIDTAGRKVQSIDSGVCHNDGLLSGTCLVSQPQ